MVSTAVTSTGDLGSVSSAGVYTAPAKLPTPNTVVVQAAYQASTTTVVGTTQVTLLNPAPTVTSLAPSSVNTGLAYSVTLNGTGFLPSSQILFNGQPVKGAAYLSATQFQLTGASTLAAGSKIAVAVTNPDPGSQTSGAVNLAVLAPISVAVTPANQTIRIGGTEAFTAKVSNAATTADQAVTWQVNSVTGGSASTGTVDAKGV